MTWQDYQDTFPSEAALAAQNLDDYPHSKAHGDLGDALNLLITDVVAGFARMSPQPASLSDAIASWSQAADVSGLKPVPAGFCDRGQPFTVTFRDPTPGTLDRTPPGSSSPTVFDTKWLPANEIVTTVSCDPGTDTFTKADHGFLDGDVVCVSQIDASSPGTVTMPGGTTVGSTFYVISASGTTFQLSTTAGGSAANFGGTTGTVSVRKVMPQLIDGIVVNVKASDLFPDFDSDSGALGDVARTTVLDDAITAVEAWNEANPDRPLWVKARVAWGYHSPDGADDYCGFISVYEDDAGSLANVSTTNGVATITKASHNLKVGQRVLFTNRATLTAVTTSTTYFVRSIPTSSTFTISATEGGAEITMDATQSTADMWVAQRVPIWWETGGTNRFVDNVYGPAQTALAAVFDDMDVLRCVTMSAGTDGWFPEPCLRGVTGSSSYPSQNWDSYIAEGFTAALDKEALIAAIRTHDAWQRTYTSLAVNPYQHIRTVAEGGANSTTALRTMQTAIAYDWCLDLMDAFRAILGERAIIESDSARINYTDPTNPNVSANYTRMYDRMVQHGSPLHFQTAATSTLHQENYDNPMATYSSVSVNTSTETFTKAGHTLADGDAVYISGTAGVSNAATGLTESTAGAESTATIYWVINADTGAGTFQLSTTRGGTAANLTGTGTCTVVHVATWRDVVEDLIAFGADSIEIVADYYDAAGTAQLARPWTDTAATTGATDELAAYAEQMRFPTARR